MTAWEYKIVDSHEALGGGLFKDKSRDSVDAYLRALGDEAFEWRVR